MTTENIMNILQIIATVIFGGLAIYFKTSTKAKTKAAELEKTLGDLLANAIIYINEAEEVYKSATHAGGEKFEYVCEKLYMLLPEPMRYVITQDMIENVVQNTFEQLEAYATKQLDNVVSRVSITEKEGKYVAEVPVTMTEAVDERAD